MMYYLPDYDSEEVDRLNQEQLERLKRLRGTVNWKSKEKRCEFLRQVYPLFGKWKGKHPDLRQIFRKEEIDHLLADSIDHLSGTWNYSGEAFFDFLVDIGYKDEPDVDEDGQPLLRRTTAVHRAARDGNYDCVDELFKIYCRFDVNYIDDSGLTHFHVACQSGYEDIVKKFLEFGQDVNCLVQKTGDSPLHLALAKDEIEVIKLLLRNGADPNVINLEGLTPLHIMCVRYDDDDDLEEMIFEICDDIQQIVQIDARGKFDNTPLHWALSCNYKKMVESLLKRGANPNVANVDGSTPLHFICKKFYYDDLAEIFFKINDDKHQSIEVNAQDKLGRTPLQWAVANFKPDAVELLLDHGADLSSFIFPTANDFRVMFNTENDSSFNFKLRLASGALAVIERLEKRGYEMDRKDVLTILALFAKYGLFDKSADLEKLWYDDERIARIAKKLMLIDDYPSLSLYDLTQSRPDEPAKLLTYMEYFKIARVDISLLFSNYHSEACTEQLCETMARGFFRRWALEFFLELTGQRLPILCCDKIIKELMNQDLYHICLAAMGQDSL
ncbi:delta-latroinsectotoxin-Lt1a-like [Trichogramma pretiosum]|uniref:delta-latroinsectotoxin-Lt1a-like n=1 Tax=Trichogramma pretiosum TaxID=7493 RepID=UPI000C719B52|nr:delta-latroinsectotoxin-Lt1a-like [Trichogramma pretiosum]